MKTQTTITKLEAGQTVTAEGWAQGYRFNTVRGYALSRGETAEEAEACHQRARSQGHDTAYSVNSGSVLVADRLAGKRLREKAARERAEAVVLAHGEIVEIEGERFRVHLLGERYADPIAFKLIA